MLRLFSSLLLSLLMISSASAVTIDWVFVGYPDNVCDPQPDTGTGAGCFGAVVSAYQIARHEVTNAQYAEFLNAVADTDTYALYNANMGSGFGGITQSGSSGSYTYSVIAGRGDMPVNEVSFYDALRFANWLHNGQPTGVQDDTTSESGAYTITALGVSSNSIPRNPGATIFLPSEDEWYKAAYYDALSTTYFDYPAESNTQTTCSAPTATPNHANCQQPDLTNVGSYTGSASPYGTFDQGGNLHEWNEAIIGGSQRGLRGGSFLQVADYLDAKIRSSSDPTLEDQSLVIGFRVASIPEPGTGLLVIAGVLGLAGWRTMRA